VCQPGTLVPWLAHIDTAKCFVPANSQIRNMQEFQTQDFKSRVVSAYDQEEPSRR
jgi:hypothetical protein